MIHAAGVDFAITGFLVAVTGSQEHVSQGEAGPQASFGGAMQGTMKMPHCDRLQAASSVGDRISPCLSRCVWGIACDTCAPRKCAQCGTALEGGKCAPASAVWGIACGVCAPQKCIDSGTALEEGELAPASAGGCQWCKRPLCSYKCWEDHEGDCDCQEASSSDSEDGAHATSRDAEYPLEGRDADGRIIYSFQANNLEPADVEESLPERVRGHRVVIRGTQREDLNGRTGTIASYHEPTDRFYVAIDETAPFEQAGLQSSDVMQLTSALEHLAGRVERAGVRAPALRSLAAELRRLAAAVSGHPNWFGLSD